MYLSFISTTMIFGTPVDITLSELALETFFPADDLTAERMRDMAAKSEIGCPVLALRSGLPLISGHFQAKARTPHEHA